MDNELTGWTQPETCGQWFYVQVETGDEWHPSGLCLGNSALAYLNQLHRQGLSASSA